MFKAEMSFISIFPTVVQKEKTCVVFKVLDQHRDYVNRSSKRVRQMNCCAMGRDDTQNKYTSLNCTVVVSCFSHFHMSYAIGMIPEILENGCIAA